MTRRFDALDKLEEMGALSPEGDNWLKYVTDPFHDKDIKATGFPDGVMGSSVISVLRITTPISVPGALAGANWDVNFASMPALNQGGNPAGAVRYGNIITTQGATLQAFPMAGISAVAVASGGTTFGNTAGTQTITINDPVPAINLKGACRIVASGMEITNTTASLYKQGQVYTWRQPISPWDKSRQNCNIGSGANWTPNVGPATETYIHTMPPGTAAQAELLDGTKQWAAADGAYVVGVLADDEIPIHSALPIAVMAESNDLADEDISALQGVITQNAVVALGTSNVTTPYTTHFQNFHMYGAYFTGLSTQTTLQLTTIYIVECFPSCKQTQLSVLANPSSPRDNLARQIYSKAMRRMPTGVPVGENPLGEWFKNVVGEVARFAAPGLKAMSAVHPAFGIAGGAASAIGSMLPPTVDRSKKTPVIQQQQQQPRMRVPRPPAAPGQGRSKTARRARNRRVRLVEEYDTGFLAGQHGNNLNIRPDQTSARPRRGLLINQGY